MGESNHGLGLPESPFPAVRASLRWRWTRKAPAVKTDKGLQRDARTITPVSSLPNRSKSQALPLSQTRANPGSEALVSTVHGLVSYAVLVTCSLIREDGLSQSLLATLDPGRCVSAALLRIRTGHRCSV